MPVPFSGPTFQKEQSIVTTCHKLSERRARDSNPQLLTEHLNSNQEPTFLKSFACKTLQKAKRAAYTQACREQLSPVFID